MKVKPELRFDHFAYPVDDLVKTEDFYTRVLEVPIYERRGLRVRDVQAGTLPRTFLNVAGSRVGILLGREPLPEHEQRHGCPSVGLEITADGMTRVIRRLQEINYSSFEEPRPRQGLGPKTISLILQDPFGNHLELLQRDRAASTGASAYVGISHLELEVTDLERSVDFYTNVFDFKLLGKENDAIGRQTACLQLVGGQWLMLHKVEVLHPRSSAFYRFEGQHYAFMTPTEEALLFLRESIAEAGGKIDALEQTQMRSATAHGLYFTDFDGNPLQLQVEGSE